MTIKKAKVLLALYSCILAMFVASTKAQNISELNDRLGSKTEGHGISSRNILEARYIAETEEVPDSCLVLLTDWPFMIELPFGRTINSVIAAGSTLPIPAGIYELKNPVGRSTSEYLMRAGNDCFQLP